MHSSVNIVLVDVADLIARSDVLRFPHAYTCCRLRRPVVLEALRNCLVEVVMLLIRRVELVEAAFVVLEWNIFLAAEVDNGWWLWMFLGPIVVDKRRRNGQCNLLLMRRGTVSLDHRDRRFGPLHFRVVHLRLVAPFL